jgi:hypothetical protein
MTSGITKTKSQEEEDSSKKADKLDLPPIMKFFTFYYFFRMCLLDICYLTLGDIPTLQIILPLTIEGIFIVIVLITAKLTNVFGSRFVVFRLALQGISIFMWLFMAYVGTMKSEKFDYRGFRMKEYQ